MAAACSGSVAALTCSSASATRMCRRWRRVSEI